MSKVTTILMTVFVMALLVACSGEKKETETKDEAPAAAATETPKEEAPKAPANEPPKELAKALAAGPGGAQNPMAALLGAEPEGANPCEKAFNGFKKMFDAMSSMAPPGANAKKPEMPTKENFIQGCSLLPENMQNCMSLHYATSHKEECVKAKQDVDPALMAKVNALIGPKKQ